MNKVRNMALGNLHGQINLFMKENSRLTILMGMVSIVGQMGNTIRDNGSIIRSTNLYTNINRNG